MPDPPAPPEPAEPIAPAAPAFPALKGAFALMLGGWLSGFIAAAAAGAILGEKAAIAVGNIAGLSLMIWAGLRRAHTPAPEVLSLRPFAPRLLLPLFLMALSASILLSELGNWMEELLPMPGEIRNLFLRVLLAENWVQFLQRAVLLSLIAPITEELMFRGVFQHGLIKNYGPSKGIGFTAVCFGVFHLIPWQAVGAILIGVLLGLVVYRTGSILAGMALHAMWNLLPLLVVSGLSERALPGYGLNLDGITHIPFPALLAASALFGLAFRHFWRATRPPMPALE